MERKDLAEAAGMSYAYLSEIETGKKRGSSKALYVLAEALGVRPSEILALGDRYASLPPEAGLPTRPAAPAAESPLPSIPAPRAIPPPSESAPSPAPEAMRARLAGPAAAASAPPPPAGRAAGSRAFRWFERGTGDPSGSRDTAARPTREQLLHELGDAAAGLSEDDLAALLDLARRLSR